MPDQFFIGQPNPVWWHDFKDPDNGVSIEDADMSGRLLDSEGQEVDDSSFVLEFKETVAGRGATYFGKTPIMPQADPEAETPVGLLLGRDYTLEIIATLDGETIGCRRIPVVAVYQADV